MNQRGGWSQIGTGRAQSSPRSIWRGIFNRLSGAKQSEGFTLIELLTVIFIIGIISTVITVNLASARKQARDVRRKTDLSTIQSALELYANANNGKVPVTTTQVTSASAQPWIPDPTGGLLTYVSNLPIDPIAPNASPYIYTYQTGPAGTQFQYSYALDATLEAEPKANVNLSTAPPSNPAVAGFYVTGTYLASDGTVHYRVSSGGQ